MRDGEARLFAEAFVEILEQRPPTGEDDAFVHDVGRELRGGLLEGVPHGIDDRRYDFGQGLADLFVGNGEGLGDTLHQIATLDLHAQRFIEGIGGAHLDLDLLGSALTQEEVVLLLEVLDDRLVHFVASHAHRSRVDDTGERNHSDIRGTPADVDDHISGGLGDRKSRPDGRRHCLFDQVDLARAGLQCGVLHGPFLDLGYLRRNRDDDPWANQERAAVGLSNEMLEHLLGDLEVGDHAVLHRANGLDVARSLAQHFLGPGADRLDPVGDPVDSDDRRLDHGDSTTPHIDQGIGRSEIDCKVRREQPEKAGKMHQ